MDLKLASHSYSRFGFGFAVSYSEVEYETGKFKRMITLKVKISIFRVFSKSSGKNVLI